MFANLGILGPALVWVLIMLGFTFALVFVRVASTVSGVVDASFWKDKDPKAVKSSRTKGTGDDKGGGLEPLWMKRIGDAYKNATEIPPYFLGVCVINHILNATTPTSILLSWVYIGLRVAHCSVHITINHVLVRMLCFLASNITLALLTISTISTATTNA